VWVSSNIAGKAGRLRFMGQSKVVDPDGTVLARTGGRAGIAVARVDVHGSVLRARHAYSHLGDRAPGSYRLGTAKPPHARSNPKCLAGLHAVVSG
jgi:predicted amidohydrolase